MIEGEEAETVAFHRLQIESPEENGDGEPVSFYKPVLELTEEEMREQVLKSALGDLISWRQRYAEFARVYKKLFGIIDKTAKQIEMELAREK